jgi:hypothetical protein
MNHSGFQASCMIKRDWLPFFSHSGLKYQHESEVTADRAHFRPSRHLLWSVTVDWSCFYICLAVWDCTGHSSRFEMCTGQRIDSVAILATNKCSFFNNGMCHMYCRNTLMLTGYSGGWMAEQIGELCGRLPLFQFESTSWVRSLHQTQPRPLTTGTHTRVHLSCLKHSHYYIHKPI